MNSIECKVIEKDSNYKNLYEVLRSEIARINKLEKQIEFLKQELSDIKTNYGIKQ